MKKLLIYIATGCVAVSCLKKTEGIEEMNTNIFDKEYQGDKWFLIEEAHSFFNQTGLPRVRVEAYIPSGNMPELKPYSVQLQCSVNEQSVQLVDAIIDNDGNYLFHYDAVPEPSGEYCLSAGIYVEEEDTAINTFVECVDL